MSSFYLIFVGLLITGFYAASTASLHCLKNEFKCLDGEKCIPGIYKCDGVNDCDDSTDEVVCNKCPESEHRCQNGTCVAANLVCNGKKDCGDDDGTDEANCGVLTCKVNEFTCRDGKKCIPLRWRCDTLNQCVDSSDEFYCDPHECPDGMLGCDSGQCVRELFFCDGRKHCDDGSDENDCSYKDAERLYLNKGPSIYLNIRTKVGLEFTHLLPLSVQMKQATGIRNRLKITGLAFDTTKNHLYISDAGEPAIKQVYMTYLTWSSITWLTLVTKGLLSPTGIAFDYTSNNLYWIDSGTWKAEVISVDTKMRIPIITDLPNPFALALSPNSGIMFIATIFGLDTSVLMYGMDGSNKRTLDCVQGSPASLAVHPSKSLLYWTDPREGTISYVDYNSTSSSSKILRKNIGRVMSVTVTERDVYFTTGEPENFTLQGVNRFKNAGREKDEGWNCITYGMKPSGESDCLIDKGGCEYFCLTSELGKTCACPSDMTLNKDGKTCSF